MRQNNKQMMSGNFLNVFLQLLSYFIFIVFVEIIFLKIQGRLENLIILKKSQKKERNKNVIL